MASAVRQVKGDFSISIVFGALALQLCKHPDEANWF
jgi:hypothetical protein